MSDRRDQEQNMDAAEAEFLSRVQRQLNQSCEGLDARTVSRLSSIRHTALEHRQKRFSPLWLSFGGMITATFLIFSLNLTSLQLPVWTETADEAATLEDIEILTTTESLDFYEEYEFYQWLAENDSSV